MTSDCSRLSEWIECEMERPSAGAIEARLDPALAARSDMADSLRTWLLSHISVASRRFALAGGEAAEPMKLDSIVLSAPGNEPEEPRKLESSVFMTPDAALPRKLESS